jgi:oligoendopeptidase F
LIIASLDTLILPLTKLQHHLSEGPDVVLKVFKMKDEIKKLVAKLSTQCEINYFQDTRDSFAQGVQSRLEEKNSEISMKSSFIEPELLSLSDEKLKEYRDFDGLKSF